MEGRKRERKQILRRFRVRGNRHFRWRERERKQILRRLKEKDPDFRDSKREREKQNLMSEN